MSILKMDNVTKKFGNFTALEGVNLELQSGEIYGFIGPNGAGKSTSIRIILGIYQATNGNATVFGQDAWNNAVDIHKKIAYVPGDVSLWPNLTGGEVIDLFIKLQGTNNTQKRENLLERFNLDPTKKCRTYSKGNRQKVALVAAFASNADLFILDEPTSGLDPLMEKVFHECVLEVKSQGKSVLLSSHILSEVEKLCDKVSIIRKGKIIQTGTLSEIRHLTRTNVFVQTMKPMTDIEKISGVYHVKRDENGVSFELDSEETPNVMSYMSQYGILKLESAVPPLEEVFMKHYDESHKG